MAQKHLNYLKTETKRKDLIRMIFENKIADVLIKGGNVVNVYTGEILEEDISIYGDRIGTVGLNDIKAKKVIDAEGKYITPGLMDGHLHIDACMLSVTSFAKAVLPHGTTSVFLDSHEIGNVMGVDGVRMMVEEGKNTPLRVFQYIPAQVPTGPEKLQTPNAKITLEETKLLYPLEGIIGLGEVSKWRVLAGDPYFVDKIEWILSEGGCVDGSAHEFSGRKLQAYVASGIFSDHESVEKALAIERARMGLTVMIREGTSKVQHNIKSCIKAITEAKLNHTNFCFCSDSLLPFDIVKRGHINYCIKTSIECGLDPVIAVQMATINCARNFGLDNELGGIAPGKVADLLIVDDIRKFQPRMVFVGGRLIAKEGKLIEQVPAYRYPRKFLHSIKIKRKIKSEELKIRIKKTVNKVRIRVIKIVTHIPSDKAVKSVYPTEMKTAIVPVRNGEIISQPSKDIIKIVVVERYGKTQGPNIGKGFVKGFGLKSGAIAQSLSQDKHDIVGIGVNDDDLALAINEVVKIQGGIVLANMGKILDTLKLPIGGIMTNKSAEEVNAAIVKMTKKAMKLGCRIENPFDYIQFLTHPMLPSFKITDLGLVDVNKQELVDLIIEPTS
jgi:adenine deaminase